MKIARNLTGSALVLSLSLAASAQAGSATADAPAQSAPAPLPSGMVKEGLVETTATVKAIDQQTRQVTLTRADGTPVSFVAGDEVRNLAQVKVGDQVKVAYYESLAYEVKKSSGGMPGASVAEKASRAKLGEKPGAAGARVTTVTATIVNIDRATMEVTLRGPDGNTFVVHAKDPQKVAAVTVGDLVDLTYTEAVAISVEPGAPAK